MSLLMLDHTTLFYWSLSNSPPSHSRKRKGDEIDKWRSTLRDSESLAPSRATSIQPTAVGFGRLSTPSVLTDDIKILSHPETSVSALSAKEKRKPASSDWDPFA